MLNVNQITSRLATMPDQALKQFAQMHKDDPYTFALAVSESNRRKDIRASAHPMMQHPKVADEEIAQMDEQRPEPQMVLPEQQGIGALPAPNMQGMAGGGIVAFKDGKKVEAAPSFDQALDMEGVKDPVRRAFLKAIYGQESGGGSDTSTSNRGAMGHMQIRPKTFKSVADADMNIKDPLDNMRAGIRYASKGYQLAGGDPKLAAAYYYGGPNGLEKAKKGIAVSDPKNPNYPNTLEYARDVSQRMASFKPITGQAAALPQSEVQANPYTNPYTGDYQPPESRVAKPDRATVLGVVKAFGTAEGIKRFGIGAVEDATIGMVGMPADLRKASATSGIPLLRGLEAATTALTPNVSKDKFTTEGLKKAATEAGIRPQESADPNVRAVQTTGEFAGYLTNPVALGRKLVGGARKGIAALESKAGSWMDELNGVKPVDALAEAKAAEAAAQAKVAVPRLEAPARKAPTTPAGSPLKVQPAPFPVSAEAQAAKEAAAKQAAARAAARAAEKPTGLAALEADKAAAEAAAARVAALESGVAKEVTAGESAAAREAAAANEARRVVASPAEFLTRTTGKDTSTLPTELGTTSTEVQAAPAFTPDYQPPNTRGYPAPEAPAFQPDYQPPNTRGLPAKEIIQTAKEAVPETAATKGFTNDDWLNLGFNLLAGKSQYAMENIGTAGVATLAAKREREKSEAAAANALQLAGVKGEWRGMVKDLMDSSPGMSYQDALSIVMQGRTGAEAKEAANAIKAAAQKADVMKDIEAARAALANSPKYKNLGSPFLPGYDALNREYEADVNRLYERYGMKPIYGPSVNKYPGVKVLGVNG